MLILGRVVTGIQDVKYTTEQEKELVYGRGNKPLGMVSGMEKYEGKIVLLQFELDLLTTAIKAIKPTGKITDAAFDIVVSYGEGITAKTDILKSVEITKFEKGMETSDKFMKVELPFMCLDIEYDV